MALCFIDAQSDWPVISQPAPFEFGNRDFKPSQRQLGLGMIPACLAYQHNRSLPTLPKWRMPPTYRLLAMLPLVLLASSYCAGMAGRKESSPTQAAFGWA